MQFAFDHSDVASAPGRADHMTRMPSMQGATGSSVPSGRYRRKGERDFAGGDDIIVEDLELDQMPYYEGPDA
jgi:hypothetical protein